MSHITLITMDDKIYLINGFARRFAMSHGSWLVTFAYVWLTPSSQRTISQRPAWYRLKTSDSYFHQSMRKERKKQNQFFMCARLIGAFQEMRGRGGGYTLDSMTYAQLARGQSILTIATLQTARLCRPNMKPDSNVRPNSNPNSILPCI